VRCGTGQSFDFLAEPARAQAAVILGFVQGIYLFRVFVREKLGSVLDKFLIGGAKIHIIAHLLLL